MLEHDFRVIGNKMLAVRKRMGMTQSEVADAAGLSDRAYADIERGSVNMRLDTFLRICEVLYVSTDEILRADTQESPLYQEELLARLNACSEKDRHTVLRILEVYLKSLA